MYGRYIRSPLNGRKQGDRYATMGRGERRRDNESESEREREREEAKQSDSTYRDRCSAGTARSALICVFTMPVR
jgi:hypothetical protein